MEHDVTGAAFVYGIVQLGGMVLGALVGLVCHLDGCTAARIWQFAIAGGLFGAAWAAYTIATGGGSGDPGRPDVVSSRDGRE
jgi:hypothetical protein